MSVVYGKVRGSVVSATNKAKQKYNFHYNNKVSKLKGRFSRMLVAISGSHGDGYNNNYNNNETDNSTIKCILERRQGIRRYAPRNGVIKQ